MPTGIVTNIQRYSLKDGPGIRTTVFLKGCPLSCAWCHNPETVSRQPEILVVEARCVRCGACVEACPNHQPVGAPADVVAAAQILSGRAGWLGGKPVCLLCGACVDECPTGARAMVGRAMTVKELLEELLADRVFYEDSGGGVTFSGGEPLLQFEFLHAALAACRERGLHTAVDTSGFAPREHVLAVAAVADLILYDVKLLDETRHHEFTGVPNERILANLRALAAMHSNIWLRVPLIPGVNDDPADLDAVARLAASLSGIRQVNLLPYHKTGIHKFARLGQQYHLTEIQPPSAEQMQAAAARLAGSGVSVVLGG